MKKNTILCEETLYSDAKKQHRLCGKTPQSAGATDMYRRALHSAVKYYIVREAVLAMRESIGPQCT
jgi:hypothetical protein